MLIKTSLKHHRMIYVEITIHIAMHSIYSLEYLKVTTEPVNIRFCRLIHEIFKLCVKYLFISFKKTKNKIEKKTI